MTMQPSRDIDAARRRAERIRIKARSITEQYSDLRALVDEAERCEDHLTLGYPSWTAYLADLFGDEPLRLPRDERIPMSQMLADKGMSTRAIGAVLGVGNKTVARDLGVSNDTPDGEASPETPAPAPERIDPVTGEVVPAPTFKPVDVTDWTDEELERLEAADALTIETWEASTIPAPEPRKVTGLDGKTYTRPPAPAQRPNRRAITDAFWEGSYDLAKRVESLRRLTEDDRFARNREAIAAKNLHDLKQTASTLAEVLAAIESINSQKA